jgi:hypothetical protein
VDMLEQLRCARETLGLDLPALEQRTRVRLHLLAAVEEGRFEELPRGVYARAVVRAYASAVGIDPNRAVTAVAALLPEQEDALDGIARVRGFARASAHPIAATSTAADELAENPAGFSAGALSSVILARSAAAAIDGAVLAAIGLVLLVLTAAAAGVTVGAVLTFAAPALLTLFALIAGLYFLLLGGILGETVGSRVMQISRVSIAAPVGVRAMSHRACEVAVRELSILVDVLLPIIEARVPGGRPGAPRSGTPWEDRAPAR